MTINKSQASLIRFSALELCSQMREQGLNKIKISLVSSLMDPGHCVYGNLVLGSLYTPGVQHALWTSYTRQEQGRFPALHPYYSSPSPEETRHKHRSKQASKERKHSTEGTFKSQMFCNE